MSEGSSPSLQASSPPGCCRRPFVEETMFPQCSSEWLHLELNLTAAGFQSHNFSSYIQAGSYSSGLGSRQTAGNNRRPRSLQVMVLKSVLLSENDAGNDHVTFTIRALLALLIKILISLQSGTCCIILDWKTISHFLTTVSSEFCPETLIMDLNNKIEKKASLHSTIS